ncbi:hypothetical protein Q1695_005883 [Nippostrongylus brasiliensis]|nr:hypothetical protein Q1695_005883 [Nippostrongylus brasiliensis]
MTIGSEWDARDRPPMNQIQFDRRFEYFEPHVENKLVKMTRKYVVRLIRPFTDFKLFVRTLLSFMPILQWLPRYEIGENIFQDAIAGFMVGVMHVPQGIAYALLAGVHPVVGLYTSFFPVLAYMLFGTSRHTSIGSFAVVALMTGNTVSRLVEHSSRNNSTIINNTTEDLYQPIEVTTALSLAIGLILIVVAIAGLDFVTTYFSEQLVAGFTTGAAVHVFVTQLKDIFGVYGTPRRVGAANAILRATDVLTELYRANTTTIVVSLITMIILLIGNRYVNKRLTTYCTLPIPFELLVVLLGTIASWLLSLEIKFKVVVVGDIPTGLPLPTPPRLKLLPLVLVDAISIAAVIMAVHISMAKLLAKKHHYSIDSKQEVFALGFTSAIVSFFPVFPCSTSLARTVVNSNAGAKTQFFAVFSSLFIFLTLQFGGAFLGPLPMCVLASIIVVALVDMFLKLRQLPELWRVSKFDLAIWLVAFTATAFIDVVSGLVIAIVFALFTTVVRLQWPNWHVLGNLIGSNDYRDIERYHQIRIVKNVSVVRFDAPLLFTNVERFREMVEAVVRDWDHPACNSHLETNDETIDVDECEDTARLTKKSAERDPPSGRVSKFLIIDCSGMVYIDMMGVACLKEIYVDLKDKEVDVQFAAPKAPVRELFETSGLYGFVNKANFYPTVHDAMFFVQRRRSMGILMSNQSSYETVELSDDTTQSGDVSPTDSKDVLRVEVL